MFGGSVVGADEELTLPVSEETDVLSEEEGMDTASLGEGAVSGGDDDRVVL